jgi:hypothetical protein
MMSKRSLRIVKNFDNDGWLKLVIAWLAPLSIYDHAKNCLVGITCDDEVPVP